MFIVLSMLISYLESTRKGISNAIIYSYEN